MKNAKYKVQNEVFASTNGFDVAGVELSERLWDFAAALAKLSMHFLIRGLAGMSRGNW